MNVKPTLVTAAIIRNNNQILIAQRKQDSFLEPNKWEFPGGKIEKGERTEDCLLREIKEELGIRVSIDQLFMIHSHTYVKAGKTIPIILIVYLTTMKDGTVQLLDCQDIQWVTNQELKNYDFVEGDNQIVSVLLQKLCVQSKNK
ncbi:MAG: (deoxy)nucleoside triphosphate pyrophosphohydrolase [Euryarchaeota archaeon]|nr:(deoxy)nucleoside triphosphate pyrophosphohydrolase [Euryarchaeota archaeon]